MSLAENLKRARARVAAGWAEPFSLDSKGHYCLPQWEDMERWCVLDAIGFGLQSQEEFNAALDALESVVSPAFAALNRFVLGLGRQPTQDDLRRQLELIRASAGQQPFEVWAGVKGRQHGEVIRVFDVAILRASASERATRGAA